MEENNDVDGKLDSIIDALNGTNTTLTGISQQFNKVVDALSKAVEALKQIATNFAKSATPGAPDKEGKGVASSAPGTTPAAKAEGEGGGLAASGEKLGAALGAANAAAGAVTGAVAAVIGIVQKLEGYVAAFSPAVIERFNRMIENFNATIGSAFVDVFVVLADVIQKAAGQIKPAMEALTPIVKTVADALGTFLVRYIQILVDQVKTFIPLVGVIIQAFEPLLDIILAVGSALSLIIRVIALFVEALAKILFIGPLFQIIGIAARALSGAMEILQELFGILEVVINVGIKAFESLFSAFFPIKDIMKQLNSAIQTVIKNLYLLAIQAAKLAGLDSVVEGILKHLEDKVKSGDTAAQSASIKSFEQIAKDLALKSSFAGGGGSGIEDPTVFYRELLAEARKTASETKSAVTLISDKIDSVKEAILGKKGADPLDRAIAATKDVAIGGIIAGPVGAGIGAGRALLREVFG